MKVSEKTVFVITWLWMLQILAVDLTPWMPQEKPMIVEKSLGLKVVDGLKVSKLPLSSWEISQARSIRFSELGNPMICGPGFIQTLTKDKETKEWDHGISFTDISKDFFDICAVGPLIFATSSDGLWKFEDKNQDLKSDGKPTKVLSWNLKDQSFPRLISQFQRVLFISGDWESIDELESSHNSFCGIIRLDLETQITRRFTHGLRKPHSIVSNLYGDVFCFDQGTQDTQNYQNTILARLIHVSKYSDNLLSDNSENFYRRDSKFPESVPVIQYQKAVNITDSVEYRHFHLPINFFYGGILATDWVNGRILFYKPTPNGSSYAMTPYVVVEPIQNNGWAPYSLSISPEGKLFVLQSQLKGPGGIFILEAKNGGSKPEIFSELDVVLRAPQPFEAWSYKSWSPLAKAIDNNNYLEILIKDTSTLLEKLSAMDCLIEKGFQFSDSIVTQLASHSPPELFAYYVSRKSGTSSFTQNWMKELLKSESAFSKRKYLEQLLDHPDWVSNKDILTTVMALCYAKDSHLRLVARQLYVGIPQSKLDFLFSNYEKLSNRQKMLTLIHARDNESDFFSKEKVESILNQVRQLNLIWEGLDMALELLNLTKDEYALIENSNKSFSPTFKNSIQTKALKIFPTLDTALDKEISRLCAFIGVKNEILNQRFLNQIHPNSSNEDLTTLVRMAVQLDGEVPKRFRKRLAQSVIRLARITRKNTFSNPNDPELIQPIIADAFKNWNWLQESLERLPSFPSASDGLLIGHFPSPQKEELLNVIIKEIKNPLTFNWELDFIQAVAHSSLSNKMTLLGQLWNRQNLRGPILEFLAQDPSPTFLNAFIQSLDDPDPHKQKLAIQGILGVSPEPQLSIAQIGAITRCLSRNTFDLEISEKERLLKFFPKSELQQNYVIDEKIPFGDSYLSIFEKTFPNDIRFLGLDPNDDPLSWKAKIDQINWLDGNIERGRSLYTQRRCIQCHSENSNFGPSKKSLQKLTPEEILEHTKFPHKSVASAYQTWMVQGGNLKFMAFLSGKNPRSALFTLNSQTSVRLPVKSISLAEPAIFSLMPGGLLEGLTPEQLSDLIAYILHVEIQD